jgi:hypothetical protein
MNHNDAVTAALIALGDALTQRHPEADQTASARFVLQQISTNQAGTLADISDAPVTIPAPVLIQLVADAIRAPVLEAQKADAEKINRAWLKRWFEARAFMKTDVPTSKKYSVVLEKWGMIGNESGKGGSRRWKNRPAKDYARMARHYFALREGKKDAMFEGQIFEPHSHHDAVMIIEQAYQIGWDEFKRHCTEKNIFLDKKSRLFPIP